MGLIAGPEKEPLRRHLLKFLREEETIQFGTIGLMMKKHRGKILKYSHPTEPEYQGTEDPLEGFNVH